MKLEMTARDVLLFFMLDMWAKTLLNHARALTPESAPEYDCWSGLAQAADGMLADLEQTALDYEWDHQRDFAADHLIRIRGHLAEALRLFEVHQAVQSRHAEIVPIRITQ